MRRLALSLVLLGLGVSVMLWPVGAQVQIIPALQGGPITGTVANFTTGTFTGVLTAAAPVGGGFVVNNSAADAGVTGQSYFTLQTATAARWYVGMSSCASDGAFGLYNNINAGCAISVSKAATSPVTFLGTITTPSIKVGTNLALRGTTPTVTGGGSTCGTSAPSIAGIDSAGKVTTGSVAPTVCVVTFSSAWTNAPACTAANETTGNLLRPTSTTTTLTLTGTMVAADVLAYTCVGY